MKLLYSPDKVARWDLEEVEYLTGFVPLYLKQWFIDPVRYSADVRNEIKFSLRMLEVEKQGNKNIWNDYVESAIQCLLGYSTTDPPLFLDRKFSRVHESSDNPPMYKVVSLFPLVEEAYRKYFFRTSGKGSEKFSSFVVVRRQLKTHLAAALRNL